MCSVPTHLSSISKKTKIGQYQKLKMKFNAKNIADVQLQRRIAKTEYTDRFCTTETNWMGSNFFHQYYLVKQSFQKQINCFL